METNQKNKLKRNLIAAVLVLMAVLLIFLCMKVDTLENEVSSQRQELEVLKGSLGHEQVQEQNYSVGEVSPVPTEGDEQVKPPAIETDRPQEVTSAEPEAKHKVYLTFDDGPSKYTEEILDILDEYDVKATFFVVGKEDEASIERLQMIYERGHTIGMHSYSHDYREIYESVDAFRDDFLKSKQYIYEAVGAEPVCYRFPGGSSNAISDLSMEVFIEFLQEQGVEYYDWNVSSGDGSSILIPVEMLVENCTDKILSYSTSIILLHDASSKSTTVEALPQVIETILAMEDTVILPITENTQPVHHKIHYE